MKIEGVNEEINGLLNMAVSGARANMLASSSELMPVSFIMAGGQISIVGGAFGNDTEKELYASAIRRLCIESDAEAVLFVTEAYMKSLPKDEGIPQNKRVSEMEGRLEVVMFQLETKNGSWQGYGTIREENGKRIFADPKMTKADGMVGRMANFLPDKNY